MYKFFLDYKERDVVSYTHTRIEIEIEMEMKTEYYNVNGFLLKCFVCLVLAY